MKVNETLDAKGLACPMPIVKTKKAITNLDAGNVLEVLATDPGSRSDIQAWADSTGHQYLGTVEEGEVLKHYLRKSDAGEEKQEVAHDKTIDNDEFKQKLSEGITVLDVREPAEYEFGHVPGAISIPLGEIDDQFNKLNKDQTVYVYCRTGNRSDFAARKLAEKGFDVFNVVPGMKEWDGELESNQ